LVDFLISYALSYALCKSMGEFVYAVTVAEGITFLSLFTSDEQ